MDDPQTVHCQSTENVSVQFGYRHVIRRRFQQLFSMTLHVYIQGNYAPAKETAFCIKRLCFKCQLVARRHLTTEVGILNLF